MFKIPQINFFFFFNPLRNFVCMKLSDLNTSVQGFWTSDSLRKAVDPNGPLDFWKSWNCHPQRTTAVRFLFLVSRKHPTCCPSSICMVGACMVNHTLHGIMRLMDHVRRSACTSAPLWKILEKCVANHCLLHSAMCRFWKTEREVICVWFFFFLIVFPLVFLRY